MTAIELVRKLGRKILSKKEKKAPKIITLKRNGGSVVVDVGAIQLNEHWRN